MAMGPDRGGSSLYPKKTNIPYLPFELHFTRGDHVNSCIGLTKRGLPTSARTFLSNPIMANRELLPPNIAPLAYDLTFQPVLEYSDQLCSLLGQSDSADIDAPVGRSRADPELTFTGQGSIHFRIKESAASTVQLHAQDIHIHTPRIVATDGTTVDLTPTIEMHEATETVLLRLPYEIPPSDYVLTLQWSGTLNTKMQGLYRSAYKDKQGNTKYMAVTQFEPTDARKAFPCFDEPVHKATFRVTLIVPQYCTCLSNMPEDGPAITSNGKKVVRFQETPIMSTYLLAFVVGELDHIESSDANGILIRVWTLPGSTHLGEFALNVAKSTLEFFTEFFGVPYPLPKCDLIAVPDFAAGAMENWGCITFRETALLLDPQNSASSAKSRVAEVVAHELAHQWFGNLVTMEWWTHLWLNEGFATWAADLAVDRLFPSWQVWMQFVCSTFSAALRLDALESSHPIEVEVNRASEVNEIFDAISYYKGASAIRMLVDFMGLENFQSGLRGYFAKHPYGNTSTDDLWKALKAKSSEPIEQMMKGWTQQTGFPMLELSLSESGALQVSQSRFAACRDNSHDSNEWIVPISYVTSQDPSNVKKFLLREKRATLLSSQDLSALDWIKVNAGQSGLYRVLYTRELYSKLGSAISQNILHGTDRLGVLMDVMALSRAGYLETTKALEVLSFFHQETEYTCLADVVSSLEELREIFTPPGNDIMSGHFDRFSQDLLNTAGLKLGWVPVNDEQHVISLARTLVLTALGNSSHQETVTYALERFREYLKNPESVPADLRIPVYFSAVKFGDRFEFDAILNLYRTTSLNEEKIRCIRALGKTSSTTRLQEALDWGWSEVKPQDLVFVVHAVASNPAGQELAWDFVTKNWLSLVDRYGRGNFLLTRFVEYSTKGFCAPEDVDRVEKFFSSVSKEGIERTIQQSLEGIRVRASWRQRDSARVESWMASRFG